VKSSSKFFASSPVFVFVEIVPHICLPRYYPWARQEFVAEM